MLKLKINKNVPRYLPGGHLFRSINCREEQILAMRHHCEITDKSLKEKETNSVLLEY